MNVTKIILTRCHIFHLKSTKFDFGWGSAQTLTGWTHSAHSWIWGEQGKDRKRRKSKKERNWKGERGRRDRQESGKGEGWFVVPEDWRLCTKPTLAITHTLIIISHSRSSRQRVHLRQRHQSVMKIGGPNSLPFPPSLPSFSLSLYLFPFPFP